MNLTNREKDKLYAPPLNPYCQYSDGRYIAKARINGRIRTGKKYNTITECNEASNKMAQIANK